MFEQFHVLSKLRRSPFFTFHIDTCKSFFNLLCVLLSRFGFNKSDPTKEILGKDTKLITL